MAATTLTTEDLLEGAQQLLAGDVKLEPGPVERAAALLARQALELRIAERLVPYGLDAGDARFSDQLLCLQGTIGDKQLARQAAALWASLSAVVHHLGYEIGPTGNDLAALVRRTARIADELRPKPAEKNEAEE